MPFLYVGDIFVPGATVDQLEPRAKMIRDQMVASYGKADLAGAATNRVGHGAHCPSASQGRVMGGKADPRVRAKRCTKT